MIAITFSVLTEDLVRYSNIDIYVNYNALCIILPSDCPYLSRKGRCVCEIREAVRCPVSHVSVTLLARENQHPHVDKVEGKKSCLM